MQGIFAGAEVVRIVVPTDGAPAAELAQTSQLLEREAAELELELGAPVSLGPSGDDAQPRLELRIDPSIGTPQATLDDAGAVLVVAGGDLERTVEALSLLRTLRCGGQRHVEARPATSLAAAIARLEREVAWTYPAFGLRDIDWPRLCARSRGGVDPRDPLPGLQRWIARLGDAHTRVGSSIPIGHVPYTARTAGTWVGSPSPAVPGSPVTTGSVVLTARSPASPRSPGMLGRDLPSSPLDVGARATSASRRGFRG